MKNAALVLLFALLLVGCKSHRQVQSDTSLRTETVAVEHVETAVRDTTSTTDTSRVEIAELAWEITADSVVTPQGATLYRPRIQATVRDLRSHERQTSHATTATTTHKVDSIIDKLEEKTVTKEAQTTAHTGLRDLRHLVLAIVLLLLVVLFAAKYRKSP